MTEAWQRPVLFEGSALPGTAIAIDHLGMYDNLPEMSEATSEWLWRFTICVGRPRTDLSENIRRHVSETISLLCQFRERLLTTVPEHYDDTFESAVLDSWQQALQKIMEISASRMECTWEAPLQPGDRCYGKSPAEIANEMQGCLDKALSRSK